MATGVEAVPACLLAGVPVLQPPHLEGDASLATEILPGPPPMDVVQQSGLPRKDHKKTAPAYSYLPVSDPGTTYGPLLNPLVITASTEGDGPRRKRARLDKSSSTTRAQRASARNLTVLGATEAVGEGVASSSHLAQDSDAPTMQPDIDETTVSRSASVVQPDDVVTSSSNKRPRRDKGKEREKEPMLRVKEEPVAISLGLHDPILPLSNEDHCSSCRSTGALVYCDGCPRAFHLWCLNPPIEASDVPEGDVRWYCPACDLREKPPGKVPASFKFMAPLLEHLQNTLPVEYQLPQDVRSFFKDVATGSKGTYVDSSEIKAPRLNRHGQLEERDPYRLKDRNGDPVLCFKCGTSALPPGLAASTPAAKRTRRAASLRNGTNSGRGIVSCDYCHLHWHLDCVDPPMSFVPPWEKRWMCPNHADHIHNPKRRVPRHNPPIVEVSAPGVANNGNVEIIHPEATVAPPAAKVAVDEVLINGRRYRVPERVITMDFWNKVHPNDDKRPGVEDESPLSSPLTELSSLDDVEEALPKVSQKGLFNVEELKAALFLCRLQQHVDPPVNGARPPTEAPIQLDVDPIPNRLKAKTPTPLVPKEGPSIQVNGTGKTEPSTKRAARSTRSRTSSSRPLRSSAGSRSQHTSKQEPHVEQAEVPQANDTPVTPRIPASNHAPPSNGIPIPARTPSLSSVTANPQPSVSTRPKRTRQPPRGRLSPVSAAPLARSTNHSDHDATVDGNAVSDTAAASPSQSLTTADPPKVFRPTPYWPLPTAKSTAPVSSTSTGVPASAPVVKTEPTSTPSLKIRLPRLGSLNTSLVTAPPAIPDGHSRTRTSTRTRTKKAPPARTRRSHRHTSGSGSLNDTPTDLLLPPV